MQVNSDRKMKIAQFYLHFNHKCDKVKITNREKQALKTIAAPLEKQFKDTYLTFSLIMKNV